jgi:hypothetical protein
MNTSTQETLGRPVSPPSARLIGCASRQECDTLYEALDSAIRFLDAVKLMFAEHQPAAWWNTQNHQEGLKTARAKAREQNAEVSDRRNNPKA